MKPRPRKCKIGAAGCDGTYTPFNSLQKSCRNPKCALEAGKAIIEKKARVKQRADKERIKPRSQWIKEAQTAFNSWVRLRDAKLPCISCGRHHKGQYHAGHYRTVGGHPELRFEPLNCQKQCAPCNNHKSGDIVNYRINLVERIGLEKVEWLEGKHEAAKWTIDDLKEIKANYNKLANAIKKELQ